MAPSNDAPISAHPRYSLRRKMIISGICGIIISLCVINPYDVSHYTSSTFLAALCWLLVSIAVSVWDIIDWRLHRVPSAERRSQASAERRPLLAPTAEAPVNEITGDGDNDDNPYRPRKITLLLDIFLFFMLAATWADLYSSIADDYRWRSHVDVESIMLCTYGSLTVLLCSVCHILCFWNELMAIKKTNWERAIGRRRQEWGQQWNQFLDAAAVHTAPANTHSNAQDPSSCRCVCSCHAEDNLHWRRTENSLIERLMRVLGKSPNVQDDDDGTIVDQDDNIHDVATINPATNRHNDDANVDLEAGPSYQHNTLQVLTPSPSTYDDDTIAGEATKPLHKSGSAQSIQCQPSPTAKRSVPDTIGPVLVKKKGQDVRKEKGKGIGRE